MSSTGHKSFNSGLRTVYAKSIQTQSIYKTLNLKTIIYTLMFGKVFNILCINSALNRACLVRATSHSTQVSAPLMQKVYKHNPYIKP